MAGTQSPDMRIDSLNDNEYRDFPLIPFQEQAESVLVTVRGKNGSAPIEPLRVEVYYSPDGKTYDSEPIDFVELKATPSTVTQKTFKVDLPVTGSMSVRVINHAGGVAETIVSGIELFVNVLKKRPSVEITLKDGEIIKTWI
jgi:hypothetical protein